MHTIRRQQLRRSALYRAALLQEQSEQGAINLATKLATNNSRNHTINDGQEVSEVSNSVAVSERCTLSKVHRHASAFAASIPAE